MATQTRKPTAPADKTYDVTVLVEGREPWQTQVTAPREGLARTRAILAYMHTDAPALAGEKVDYVVTEA